VVPLPFVAVEDCRLAAAFEVPTTAYDTSEG